MTDLLGRARWKSAAALPQPEVLRGSDYWEELSSAEVAHVVGIPAGTVRSRLRSAREQLQAIVADGPVAGAAPSSADDLQRWASEVRGYLRGPGS